jgi:hypothetical protein
MPIIDLAACIMAEVKRNFAQADSHTSLSTELESYTAL